VFAARAAYGHGELALALLVMERQEKVQQIFELFQEDQCGLLPENVIYHPGIATVKAA